MSTLKEPCKYGAACYRRNPEHFDQFTHPPQVLSRLGDTDRQLASDSTASTSGSSLMQRTNERDIKSEPNKRIKIEKTDSEGIQAIIGGEPKRFGFYLSKVDGIEDKFNRLDSEHSVASAGISDILHESTGQLIESAQFSYMFEVDWLVKQYPTSWRKCPLYLVHGVKGNGKSDLENEAKDHPNVVLVPVKIFDPYGTHHTKMMLLLFESGLRIVIHTANMISGDWHQKTQGIWVSPIFPRLGSKSVENCETNFKADLIAYLRNYKSKEIDKWISTIQRHDLSAAKVYLIASVPGRHKDINRNSYGHMKLRKVLGDTHGPDEGCSNWPVVCQFSNIGSLGPDPSKWLTSQFLSSMAKTSPGNGVKPPLKCIFPTVENVRTSLEGYSAGGNLPYGSTVAERQPYLTQFFHQWVASSTGRSEASPHIKTYCRLSPDCTEISWFLLTSANLSKAAWGELQLQGSQLAIRSFELGVLFLPKSVCGADTFQIKPNQSDAANYFPLPYDTPLTPYSSSDEPWMWDKFYVEKPDRHLRIWAPDTSDP